MSKNTHFLTGIIEGFYGRRWPPETRYAYTNYLADAGLNTYVYCPKGDAYLRTRWQEDWPASEWCALSTLASACADKQLNFGVGLSPVELYRHYGVTQKAALRRKIERLRSWPRP